MKSRLWDMGGIWKILKRTTKCELPKRSQNAIRIINRLVQKTRKMLKNMDKKLRYPFPVVQSQSKIRL